jgi:hypothetical protein
MTTIATETQQQKYERALQRADAAGVVVKWFDGKHAYVSSSCPGQPNHEVVIHEDTMTCDCTGGQYEAYCMHRAVLRREILLRRFEVEYRRRAQTMHV